MKKITFVAILLASFINQHLVAQLLEEPSPYKKVRISDISVQYGTISLPYKAVSLAEFQKIAPQSAILKKDFSQFSQSSGTGMNTNTVVSMLVGIEFGEKTKKGHPELRVGLNYFSTYDMSTSLYKSERKHCDTLISTQTGEMIFLDSVRTQSCNAQYYSEQLRLDLSYIYRTQPAARLSAFVGVGATVGTSLNSATKISYYNAAYKEDYNVHYSNYYSSATTPQEVYDNPNNFYFSAYIPMGCDFRIFKKKLIANRLHLFYEARPGISFSAIPNYGVLKGVSFQQGLGIKIKI